MMVSTYLEIKGIILHLQYIHIFARLFAWHAWVPQPCATAGCARASNHMKELFKGDYARDSEGELPPDTKRKMQLHM